MSADSRGELLNMDIFNNISHCLPNDAAYHVPLDCLQNTLISSLPAGFIFIFGSIKFIEYWRYGTRIENLTKISTSKLYYLQIFLLTLIPALSALNLFPSTQSSGYTVNLHLNFF